MDGRNERVRDGRLRDANGGNANERTNADGGYIRRFASVSITLDRVMSSPDGRRVPGLYADDTPH